MNSSLLLAAPPAIQIHAAAAVGALLLGVVQFARPKGGGGHRTLGWIWVVLMTVVAVSSFWIQTLFGGFGPIHGLSLLTLAVLPLAVHRARSGAIARHRASMVALFVGALVITGLFTLLPGRLLGQALIGW